MRGNQDLPLCGGCGIFIKSSLQYIPRTDLDRKVKDNNTEVEMKWVEILDRKDKKKNKIIGVIYRHPRRKYIGFIKESNPQKN